jgi:hypothetical protein
MGQGNNNPLTGLNRIYGVLPDKQNTSMTVCCRESDSRLYYTKYAICTAGMTVGVSFPIKEIQA